MDYIFFIYGLSFILMASQCLFLRNRDRSLPWGLLAAFGIIHGINEWLDMLAISLPDSPIFKGARLVIMAVSFVALVEFGRRGLRNHGRPLVGRWLTPTLLALAALGALSGDMNGINAACRYALGFPGALMAAAALWRVSRACEGSHRYGLRLAALSMLVYGLATGLVVPKAAFFPAVWLNHNAFLAAAGFPVQLIRMLCAFAVMAGLWFRGLREKSSNKEIEFVRHWSFPMALVLLLIFGWFTTNLRAKSIDTELRGQLLTQAEQIAETIDPELVKALSFTAADKDNPAFQRLRKEMIAYRSCSDALGIHSIAIRGSKLVFGPESYATNDPVASPPGTVFERPAPEELNIFKSRTPFVIGPVTNEYGDFVSAYSPVIDPINGELLMAVGLAITADNWKSQVAITRLVPIIGTLIICLILFGCVGAIHWRNALPAEKQPRFRYLESALLACVGLALTVLLVFLTLESNNRERRRIFQQIVQTHADKTNNAFRAIRSDVAVLGRFVAAEEELAPRREFHKNTKPMLDSGTMHGLGWIQYVPAAQRAGVERIGDFTIWQKDARGERAPAPLRSKYYPVILEESFGNKTLLGFDEGSEPSHRAALEKAASSGLPTITDSVTVINKPFDKAQDGGQQAPLVFYPIFTKPFDGAQDGYLGGERRLRGFTYNMINYQTLLDHATGNEAGEEVMVETLLLDLMSADGPRLLAVTPKENNNNPPKIVSQSYLERYEFHNISPIFAFGRAYAVASHPTRASFAAYPARNHIVTGVAGLLITIVLALMLGFFSNRKTFLEREVRERTSELQKSQSLLIETGRTAHVGGWEIDLGTQELTWTEEVYIIHELDPSYKPLLTEAIGFYAPTSKPIIENAVKRAIENNEPFGLELEIITAKGNLRWVHAAGKAYQEHGITKRICGSFHDITERKVLTQQLEETATQVEGLMNQVVAGDSFTGRFENLSLSRCWEEKKCNKTKCPSYENFENLRCWEVAGTFCGDKTQGTFAQKYGDCTLCPVYRSARTNPILKMGETFNTMMAILDERRKALLQANAEIDTTNRQLEQALLDSNQYAVSLEIAKGEIEENAVELSHQATHDALTGLPNRHYFEEHLRKLIKSASDKKSYSLALLFLDLDNFKIVNDAMGHTAGDKMLVDTAARLSSCLRDGDFLARMGGDEFTILLDNINSKDDPAVIAQRILEQVSVPYEIDGSKLAMGASIGVSIYPDNTTDAVGLLKFADAAMYRAKEVGRNNCQFFSDEISQANLARVEMEQDLRLAIERDEIKVYYQPIVDIRTMQIAGAEALLRWNHPENGIISPGLFIPVAEQTGMILQMGKMVLETACKQCRIWHDMGYANFEMSVNVSPIQLSDIEFVSEVDEALSQAGLPPGSLKIEVTETTLAKNDHDELDVLGILKSLGVSISLDDFGVGYSSLSRLNKLPISHVKIDGCFIRNCDQNKGDRAMTQSIIVMAHNLGMRVTAEWVEDQAQMAVIRSLDCDYAQGYLISPALPAEAFGDFIRKWMLAHQEADAA